MKRFSKVLALVLVFSMLLSISTYAKGKKVTIEVDGQTVTYKLLVDKKNFKTIETEDQDATYVVSGDPNGEISITTIDKDTGEKTVETVNVAEVKEQIESIESSVAEAGLSMAASSRSGDYDRQSLFYDLKYFYYSSNETWRIVNTDNTQKYGYEKDYVYNELMGFKDAVDAVCVNEILAIGEGGLSGVALVVGVITAGTGLGAILAVCGLLGVALTAGTYIHMMLVYVEDADFHWDRAS